MVVGGGFCLCFCYCVWFGFVVPVYDSLCTLYHHSIVFLVRSSHTLFRSGVIRATPGYRHRLTAAASVSKFQPLRTCIMLKRGHHLKHLDYKIYTTKNIKCRCP